MLRPFLTTIVISVISVILLKPVYDYFLGTKIVKERKGLAVTLTLLCGFLIVVIPLFAVVRLSITQLTEALAAVNTQDAEALIGPYPRGSWQHRLVSDSQRRDLECN